MPNSIDKQSRDLFGAVPRSSPSTTRFESTGAFQVAAASDGVKLALAGPEDDASEWYVTAIHVDHEVAIDFAVSIIATVHEALADMDAPPPSRLHALYDAAFGDEVTD